MRVAKVDGVYKTSRISGPKHNYLGLIVTLEPPLDVRLIQRKLPGEEAGNLDELLLLAAVEKGVLTANSELDCRLSIKMIEYVPTDTPEYAIYTELAKAIAYSAAGDLACIPPGHTDSSIKS